MKQSQVEAVPGIIVVALTGIQSLVDVEAVAFSIDPGEEEYFTLLVMLICSTQ